MNMLNIRSINNWLMRFVVLLILGIPAFSGWPLNLLTEFFIEKSSISQDYSLLIYRLAAWLIYTCIIWLVVLSSVGANKFFEYLAAAFVFGLTTALLGSILRKLLPILAGSMSYEEISYKMVNLLLVIVTLVPYLLLFVNSFSAKNIVQKFLSLSGKRRTVGLHLALSLRVLQHSGEVVYNLMEIWKEEHPSRILPRHHRDWGSSWYSGIKILPWAWSAVLAWIYAAIIHTLEPIPNMVDEVEQLNKA